MSPSDLPTHIDHLANQMELVAKVALEGDYPDRVRVVAHALHQAAEATRVFAKDLREIEGANSGND